MFGDDRSSYTCARRCAWTPNGATFVMILIVFLSIFSQGYEKHTKFKIIAKAF